MDVLLLAVLVSAKLACLPPSRRENEAPGSVLTISQQRRWRTQQRRLLSSQICQVGHGLMIFLEPEERFVKSCLAESSTQYSDLFVVAINRRSCLISRLNEMLNDHILCSNFRHKVLGLVQDNSEEINKTMPRLKHISDFQDVFPQFSTAESNVSSVFPQATASFCNTGSASKLAAKLSDLCHGISIRDHQLGRLNSGCENMLLVMQLLHGNWPEADQLLTATAAQVAAWLGPCRLQMMSVLEQLQPETPASEYKRM